MAEDRPVAAGVDSPTSKEYDIEAAREAALQTLAVVPPGRNNRADRIIIAVNRLARVARRWRAMAWKYGRFLNKETP